MRRATTLLAGLGLALAFTLPSSAQERSLPTQTTTISGTIETINGSTRAMNIRQDDGNLVAVTAPLSVTRFNELKVGDHVNATYNNNVSVRLKPPGEPAINTAQSSLLRTSETGGTRSMERRMTATVVDVDKETSAISFQGPDGWKYSRRVVEPAVLDQVKAGDRVDITWNTDLSINVVR